MNIFLTGSTGFLGSHFLSLALKSGHHVKALRRIGSKARLLLTQEPDWIEGYLDSNWRNQLDDCDVLVHLAATGVYFNKENWKTCFDINMTKSLELWKQAVESGVKRFIICGSCFEYGLAALDYEYIPASAPLLPTNAYSASKAAATITAIGMANQFDLKLRVVRPFHIYGEGEAECRFWPSLMKAAHEGKDFYMSGGEQIRDFIHVGDVAKSILESIYELDDTAKNISIKNIGTGFPKTLLAFAEEQWSSLHAKGRLLPGSLPYRPHEMMRYVPQI